MGFNFLKLDIVNQALFEEAIYLLAYKVYSLNDNCASLSLS